MCVRVGGGEAGAEVTFEYVSTNFATVFLWSF